MLPLSVMKTKEVKVKLKQQKDNKTVKAVSIMLITWPTDRIFLENLQTEKYIKSLLITFLGMNMSRL